MKASRLLSILMLLQAHGRQTASSLATKLEVSVRTILRDIDELSAAGIPIWGDRGRRGGFELRGGWTTQLTGMTEDEAAALPLANLPETATQLGLGAAAVSARLKLLSGLPAAWREHAEHVGSRLHVDPHEWYHQPDSATFLPEVANAVWRSRRLNIRYESWKGVDRRTLEPLGLVIKAGTWYLVARSTGQSEIKTYRLARILALSVGQAFSHPKTFDLRRFWAQSRELFENDVLPLQARVRLSPRGLEWVVSRQIRATAVPAAIPLRENRTGWVEVVYPLESVERGARQLLNFGAHLEVVEPPALRAEMVRLASEVIALHGDPKGASKRAGTVATT